MPNKENSPVDEGLDVKKVLAELEVPFPPDQVRWRVMNTSNDKKRGQIVPYADPRAYTDRLNALFSPQGWTRTYRVETMNNITRMNKGEAIITGKVLVTCTVMIAGIGSHSGTGEEWADDPNGMTAADAQAFKRACAVFGLGRYFYALSHPGSIWIRIGSREGRRHCRFGRFQRTGAKECGLQVGMAIPDRQRPIISVRMAPTAPSTLLYLNAVRAMARTAEPTGRASRPMIMAMPLP